MKHIKKVILGLGVAATLAASFNSCTDSFDDANKNPNKLYEGKAEYVFQGIVYKSMKTIQEINYRYLVSIAGYNIHWWTQPDKDAEDYSKMLDFYTNSLKDLKKLELQYAGDEDFKNTYCMLMTWKCYIYYYMVCSWGDVPLTEANASEIQQTYKYDSQEAVYNYLLETLDKAVADFDVNGDAITKDPIFDNSVDMWRKFANTLRLQIALTIQNSDPQLAETHVRKAFEGANANYILDTDAVFTFGDDLVNDASWIYNAYTQKFDEGTNNGWSTYGKMVHNFYLYMRSYDDPRIAKFTQPATGKMRSALKNDTITKVDDTYPELRDSIIVQYLLAYDAPRYNDGYTLTKLGFTISKYYDSNGNEHEYRSVYSDITSGNNQCNVSYDFMKRDAIMPLITLAETNFMKAEVAVKYPGVVPGTAESYYNEGIRASMAFWGVPSADVEAYLNRDGVKWNTDGEGVYEYRGLYKADIKGANNPLEQIYKQWYIADFFNGFAGWTLERRTRVMKFPPRFYNGSPSIEGSNGLCDWVMERFTYPINEHTSNTDAWKAACQSNIATAPGATCQGGVGALASLNNGDNMFTMLRFAKRLSQNDAEDFPAMLSKWSVGDVEVNGKNINREIHYHDEFARNPYGASFEEILKTLGAKTEAELKTLVSYSAAKLPYSVYDPTNGRKVSTYTKNNKLFFDLDENGHWIYADEKGNEGE